MSSILKALRKVEDDKAALGEGSVDLAHDILKQNYRQSSSSFWPFALWGLLLLVLLAIGAWFWLIPDQQVAQKSEQVQPQAFPASVRVAVPATAESQVFDEKLSEQPRASTSGTASADVVGGPVVEIPLLQVEEIIFQQDSAARMAVINGLPVMEGTDIDGVRVEQIFIDKVQFAFQGIRFNKYKMSRN